MIDTFTCSTCRVLRLKKMVEEAEAMIKELEPKARLLPGARKLLERGDYGAPYPTP